MKLLYALALILLWSTSAFAQVHGEILVLSPNGELQANHLVRALQTHYRGTINIVPTLPPTLSYDAILVCKPGWATSEGLLSESDQLQLADYVRHGGKFYAEAGNFRSIAKDDTDTLWSFLGLTRESLSSAGIRIDSILGEEGEFTEGIVAFHPFNLDPDAPYGLHIEGMTPILKTSPVIAWRSTDPNLKAVIHWPVVGEHYDAFIGRLLCSFFELCTMDIAQTTLPSHISFDAAQSRLFLPSPGSIVVSDLLGRTVLETRASTTQYVMPKLLAGSFIVTWTNGTERASAKIIIH